MSGSRRVVVTGVGVVTPVGIGLPAFRDALAAGRVGVRAIRGFDVSALPVRIGAEVEGFDPRDYLEKKDRKSLKMMTRTIQFAVAAARLALEDAGIPPSTLDPDRFGVSAGTGTIPGELIDIAPAAQASYDDEGRRADLRRWGREGLPLIVPTWMLNHVPNMPASHVSILNNAQGPNNTITQSDAASLLALAEAVRVLRRDAADVMLTGGGDTRVATLALLRYCLFGRLSRRNEDPERACRPFDRDRDGPVLGEGGGMLVLEEREHARRRDARVYAEVLGTAAAFDAGRTGAGLARVIRLALARAGITPDDLDHVNAHAGGWVEEDAWEARGLREAVSDTPVLAAKSYFGNLGAAADAVELAASLAAAGGVVPATRNCETADERCPVRVLREPRPPRKRYVLKTGCTERGQCAAVVLRYEG
jgi:3-oxoacyl-[acyl-carrier-protein] synthase II